MTTGYLEGLQGDRPKEGHAIQEYVQSEVGQVREMVRRFEADGQPVPQVNVSNAIPFTIEMKNTLAGMEQRIAQLDNIGAAHNHLATTVNLVQTASHDLLPDKRGSCSTRGIFTTTAAAASTATAAAAAATSNSAAAATTTTAAAAATSTSAAAAATTTSAAAATFPKRRRKRSSAWRRRGAFSECAGPQGLR